MVTLGAQVGREDAEVIVGYLSEHYVPLPTTGRPGPRPAVECGGLPSDGPGRDVLTRKCFQCHGQGMWQDLRPTAAAGRASLYRMVGRGALWTEDEIDAMADYLARALGRPSPSGRAR